MSKTGWNWTPLFVAKRVVMAREGSTPPALLDERGDPGTTYEDIAPRQVVSQLDLKYVEERMFAPPKNGAGIRMFGGEFQEEVRNIKSEKDLLNHVFSYVWHFSEKELAERVNPEINYVALMQGNQAPGWMRGKIAGFRGRAGYVEPWRFPEDGSGITRMYLVYGHDERYADPGYTWVLATLNLPEGLREDDLLEAKGVFLKLYPYKTPARKWHWAPLIVCKHIRRVPPSKSNMYFIIALAGLLVLGLILLFVASRRDTATLEAMRKRTQERRLQRDRERIRQKSGDPVADGGAPPTPADSQAEARPEEGDASPDKPDPGVPPESGAPGS